MDEQDMMNQNLAQQMARVGYMNTNSNDINSLLSELTNPEQDILEVEMSLKGQQYDEKNKIVNVHKPLLNDPGVANMIRLMRSMVSRVMFMSNLEDEDIRAMTIELSYQIQDDLIMHKKEYEIRDVTDMTTIRTIVSYKAFEAGMSALENGFRRFLKSGIIETTVNTQGNPMKTGKGGLGSILGLGKK